MDKSSFFIQKSSGGTLPAELVHVRETLCFILKPKGLIRPGTYKLSIGIRVGKMVIGTRGGLPILLKVPPLDLLGLAFFRLNLCSAHVKWLRDQGASVITDLGLLEDEDYKAGNMGIVTRKKLLMLAKKGKEEKGGVEKIFL